MMSINSGDLIPRSLSMFNKQQDTYTQNPIFIGAEISPRQLSSITDDIGYEGPINDIFKQLGFGSTVLAYNIGTMIVPFIIYPLLVFITWLLSRTKLKKPLIVQKFENYMKISLYWLIPISILRQSYSFICLVCMINMPYVSIKSYNLYYLDQLR